MFLRKYPNNLPMILEKRGWSLVGLSKRTGIATASLCRYVAGFGRPRPKRLLLLCRAIQATPKGIYGETPAAPARNGKYPNNLENLLSRKEWSLKELASHARVSFSVAEKIFYGLILPSEKTLRKVCRALYASRKRIFPGYERLLKEKCREHIRRLYDL